TSGIMVLSNFTLRIYHTLIIHHNIRKYSVAPQVDSNSRDLFSNPLQLHPDDVARTTFGSTPPVGENPLQHQQQDPPIVTSPIITPPTQMHEIPNISTPVSSVSGYSGKSNTYTTHPNYEGDDEYDLSDLEARRAEYLLSSPEVTPKISVRPPLNWWNSPGSQSSSNLNNFENTGLIRTSSENDAEIALRDDENTNLFTNISSPRPSHDRRSSVEQLEALAAADSNNTASTSRVRKFSPLSITFT
ncbi:13671_t:CDS:1, partial [Ambispora gerdemannii]